MAKKDKALAAANTGDDRYATLEDAPAGRDTSGKTPASASNDCRPDVCELQDNGEKWSGLTNYSCNRCQFSTVDEAAARARNPKAFA